MRTICSGIARGGDLADAERVADALGISFEVVNYVDFYHRESFSPWSTAMPMELRPTRTFVHRSMKFGALLEHALEKGFDGLATGHYCIRKSSVSEKAELWEGRDKNKINRIFSPASRRNNLRSSLPLGEIKKTRSVKFGNSTSRLPTKR